MFSNIKYIVMSIFATLLVTLGLLLWFKSYQLEVRDEIIRQQKVAAEIKDVVHKVRIFDTNQTIIFKSGKEKKDEEIPSSVGVHTIVFD